MTHARTYTCTYVRTLQEYFFVPYGFTDVNDDHELHKGDEVSFYMATNKRYVHTYMDMYVYTCMDIWTYMYGHVRIYMYGHMDIHVWTCTYIHVWTYGHTCMDMYVYTSRNSSPSPDNIRTKLSNVRTKVPNSGQILIHFPINFQNVRTIFKCCCKH